MFRRVFPQLLTKAEKLHREHNGSGETLSLLAMCTIQRKTGNKVINNDTELLIKKFAGKHGRNTHFF